MKHAVVTILYLYNILIFLAAVKIKKYQFSPALLFLPHLVYSNPAIILFTTISVALVGLKYVVYSLVAPWHKVRQAIKRLQTKSFLVENRYPLVSVVIPAWNEEVGLETTLKAILATNYRPLEAIVINDGSTDNSDAIIRAFIEQYERKLSNSKKRIAIHYQYQQNGGKSRALNYGLRIAQGEIVITADADSLFFEDTVEQFVKEFADPEVIAVAGSVRIGNTRTLIGTMQSIEYIYSYYLKNAEAFLGSIIVIPGPASAFRKKVFDAVGAFNPAMLTEDMELSLRIHTTEKPIIYAENAKAYTEGPTDLHALIKQRKRWKRGWIEAFWLHRTSFFSQEARREWLFFWIILPLVVVEFALLVPTTLLMVLFYISALLTGNFTQIALLILFATCWFIFLTLREKEHFQLRYLLLAPIAIYFSFFSSVIETYSFCMALWDIARKYPPHWQKWQRQGALE
jgi:cellulose synthase/poly-beta-1,6-N-acetylglucosamine synthase-like glycosyltransferase